MRLIIRFTHSCPSLVLSSTSDPEDDTKRLSECTSVAGTAVKRHMEH